MNRLQAAGINSSGFTSRTHGQSLQGEAVSGNLLDQGVWGVGGGLGNVVTNSTRKRTFTMLSGLRLQMTGALVLDGQF